MKKASALLALIVMFAVVLASPMGASAQRDAAAGGSSSAKATGNVYIVHMSEDPVVAYAGGISGLPATRPAQGRKIDRNSSAVRRYVAHLDARHNTVLNAVGAAGSKFYDYRYSFNGFAAQLTAAQVAKLRVQPGVVSVETDVRQKVDTANTPTFLGLNADRGLWHQLGGQEKAGEDIVVGIVDTGIWPEHPSFSDQTDLADRPGEAGKRTRAYGAPPASWKGTCQSGEQWAQDDCNNKLIGARYYNNGYRRSEVITHDFISPRDYDGHGSHTASTAAGNAKVDAVVAPTGSLGTISGMAPRARIAAYKVCWNGDAGGCFNTDSVAAIDDAVADGVDGINFSISGTSTNFLDAVERAFLFASQAGVFVSASAGNSGPGESTVAHISPWLTTVAASTYGSYDGAVTLGNRQSFVGASRTVGLLSTPLIDSKTAPAAGSTEAQAELCYPGSLDSAKVAGKIVLCQRGVFARTDKSLAVQQAGGVGLVLYNPSPSSLNADLHYVPTVHIDETAGAAVKAYLKVAGANATASIAGGTLSQTNAPAMAAFSSRGPSLASGDLLKPDVTAPGVDILAAYTPVQAGRSFDFLSGTSMSSPHVQGIGALLKDLHPTWSPAMIKSALMTSAYQTNKSNASIGTPFDMGAGHIQPNSAADPGLVYDAGFFDYLGFLKGQHLCCATSASIKAIDASDLNLASIAIGGLTGTQTVKRTVTNVGETTATYNVSVEAVNGVDVRVEPERFTVDPGKTATYTVKFTTRDGANYGAYAFGALTWSDGIHHVRSPLVVRPLRLAAPDEVEGTGASGSTSYDVTFGYEGAFSALPHGLIPGDTLTGNVVDDPTNEFSPALTTGVTKHMVTIDETARYARFSLFDDFTDGADDLDLYVYDSEGNFVGGSGSGTSAEEVNLVSPKPDTYTVYVHGWETDGPDANYTLFNWVLSDTAAGNMTVTAPVQAAIAQTGTVQVNWSGLVAGTKYLGSVSHHAGDAKLGMTIVRVDP